MFVTIHRDFRVHIFLHEAVGNIADRDHGLLVVDTQMRLLSTAYVFFQQRYQAVLVRNVSNDSRGQAIFRMKG